MAFGAVTLSDFVTCDANYEFFTASGAAIAIQLNPTESVTLIFNVDSAGTTDNVDIQVCQGQRISNGNGLDGATAANDVELNTSSDGFSTDDDMNGTFIVMTSGDEAGEGRLITDSVAADDGVVLEHALSGTPSASETYALYRLNAVRHFIYCGTAIGPDFPHHSSMTCFGDNGEWVLVRVRATGATDAHRVRMSYQKDGLSN